MTTAEDVAIPPPAPPEQRKRWPLIVGIAVAAVLILGAGGAYAYDRWISEDSGVTACKVMREDSGVAPNLPDNATAAQQFKAMRALFSDSRHKDIAESGTTLMDAAIAADATDPDNTTDEEGLAALNALMGYMENVRTACGAHGVVLKEL